MQADVNSAADRRAYLLEMYRLYHGHINSMFNFYLVVGGLVGNAAIQTFSPDLQLPRAITCSIALFGAFLSLVFLLVHMRSRDLLDTIEEGLRVEETVFFARNKGFLNVPPTRRQWFFRHKYQFPITYVAFIAAFVALAVFSLQYEQPSDSEKAAQPATASTADGNNH